MKRVLITGASRGLGAALCREFLENSTVEVITLGRTPFPEVHERLQQFHADFADLDALTRKLSANEIPTNVDVIILNAGTLTGLKMLSDLSLNEITKVMNANVWANKVILDHVLKFNPAPSQVIALSSGAAQVANKGWAAYTLSKSTLNKLIEIYAAEHPMTHFTSLAPGLVATDMLQSLLDRKDTDTFESLQFLHDTEKWSASYVAEKIVSSLTRFRNLESGSYYDLRIAEV